MTILRSPEVSITQIAACVGHGESLSDLTSRAVDSLGDSARGVGSVVAATFSNQDRFPSLAVRVASSLGLPASVPAFDIQMACSAYPYALYVASRLASDTHLPSLVIDGDVQSPFVDASDHATGSIFSDAATATIVTADAASPSVSPFSFLTRHDASNLSCAAAGPIKMDGFGVFTFVATEVSSFLREFLAEAGMFPDMFAPHQANPYMVRQLAKSLGLSDRLLAIDDSLKNPGSCSVAMALAADAHPGTALVAGFGAGLSAAAGIVRIADGFKGIVS